MTKRHCTLIATAVASVLAASQAQAQITYSSDDLLLNFRNTANITGNDLEIDVGTVAVLMGEAQGTPHIVVPANVITGVFGTPGTSVPIGFSAAAADPQGTTGLLWLTRADTSANASGNLAPTTVSGQQTFTSQNPVAIRIANIGAGADAGTSVVTGATTVPGANSDSYQSQGQQSASQTGIINFGSGENVASTKGGNIESIQNASSGNVYEALWEVPVTGTADTYEGYFTFQPSGEVDFLAATPEPSTYALFGMAGLLALGFRRQLRSLFA